MITHYGLFREHAPDSPAIKEADFFQAQGGFTEQWGVAWKPIEDCKTVGEARRKFAASHGVELSFIYIGEK